MTTEEAIKDLKQWAEACRFASDTDRDGYWAIAYRKDAEALEMAIEALSKTEPTLKEVELYCRRRCLTVITDEMLEHLRRGKSDD